MARSSRDFHRASNSAQAPIDLLATKARGFVSSSNLGYEWPSDLERQMPFFSAEWMRVAPRLPNVEAGQHCECSPGQTTFHNRAWGTGIVDEIALR
jgi:hypothetical protein